MEAANGLVRVDPDAVEPYPSELDLNQIPITALRQKCRSMLSGMLNAPKILLSEEGLPRDWRGIAHLANLHSSHGALIAGQSDPMGFIIQVWSKHNNEENKATFEQLVKFLGLIDRWDVADDIREDLIQDAKNYLTNKHDQSIKNVTQFNSSPQAAISDSNILTIDDVKRSHQGLPPQQYDGFVLFAEQDIDFATELIERMEDCGFKLCVKQRDLLGGISFEHEAILRLISERCNRLIAIVSPAFLESTANTFFINFAQAIGIEEGKRKIVPCLYQRCTLPLIIQFYFVLNYQRSGKLWNFWEKLKDSIQSTPEELSERKCERNQLALPSITITEVDSSSSLTDVSSPKIFPLEQSKNSITRKCRDKEYSVSSQDISPISCNDVTSSSEHSDDITSPVLSTSEPTRCKIMPPPVKMRTSASMGNFESATTPSNLEVCDITSSNSSINGSIKTAQSSTKKMKWYKRFLSPNGTSGDTTTTTTTATKEKTKRKWFRRKLASYS